MEEEYKPMNKFEKLVEFIINEDEEKAQELFHEIVVEKSREIYNDLVNESEDQTDDFVADIEADEYGTDMHAEDEHEDDEDEAEEMEDEGDEQEEADMEEIEDRVVDLEAELDALKAEFDAMMADEEPAEEPEMEMEAEEEPVVFEDDEEEIEEDEEELEESEEELEEGEEIVREYTEKVAAPKGEDHKADSTVASKNDMGGTASNIAQGGEEAHGKAPVAKEENAGNKNVPGGSQSLEKA